MSAIDKIINGSDKYGNTYLSKDGKIYLKPEGEDRTRQIGVVGEKDGKTIYVKYEKESQRFRKTNAWSINWHVGKFVDVIYFITDEEKYKISKQKAKKHGDFFHFKSSTEKKLYVPVEFWIKKSDIANTA